MRSVIFFFLVFLCNYSYGLNAMNLILEKSENNLVVYLLSGSSEEVLVNRRFAVGPSGGLNELQFVFSDKSGNTYPFAAKIKPALPEQDDIVALGHGMLVGKAFNIEMLIKLYGLSGGSYQVQAVYQNQHNLFNAYLEKIESVVLEVDIP